MDTCAIFVKQVDVEISYAWQVLGSDDKFVTVFTKQCVEIPADLGITTYGIYRICGTNEFGTTCSSNSRYEIMPPEEEGEQSRFGKKEKKLS